MKKELENITFKLREELPRLRSKYHVAELEIFGSFVRNEKRANSNLDILVSFSKAPSLFKFIELEDYLSALFGIKVDFVMRSSLKPNIVQKILAEARSII